MTIGCDKKMDISRPRSIMWLSCVKKVQYAKQIIMNMSHRRKTCRCGTVMFLTGAKGANDDALVYVKFGNNNMYSHSTGLNYVHNYMKMWEKIHKISHISYFNYIFSVAIILYIFALLSTSITRVVYQKNTEAMVFKTK